MEQPLITAVTHSTEEARVTIKGVPDTPGIAGRIATALAVANVNIDMIIQNEPVSEGAGADMSFTVPRSDLADARVALAPLAEELGLEIQTDEAMGKVSVIGAGMKSHPGVAAKVFTDARRRGREHRDDLDVADQDLLRHRRRRRARRRARAARRVRAVGRGHDPRRAAVRGVRMSPASAGGLRVAVVGATGAVGTVMLRLLRDRAWAVRTASRSSRSPRSARSGASSRAGWWSQPLDDDTIQGFDVALFSAGATRSREWAQRFVDAGAVVVDNSSAFRMVDEVPLVVSEVNPEALDGHSGIVANPNCTTMVAMLPLKALHDEFELREMVATSYQAAGGAGQKGIDELAAQIAPLASDVAQLCDDGASAAGKVAHSVHAATLAFNVVPLLGTLGDDDHTDEERKLRDESRKILGLPELAVSPTCVRVPVMVGHGVAVRAVVRARGRPRARAGGAGARSPTSSSTTSRRRWSTPAATRSPSAACAATSATRTR